jgi:MFS family permease
VIPASHRRLTLLLGGNVLFGTGLFFHAFLYNFYLEALGHDEAVMGLAAAALTAGGLCALVPAGRLIDRFGPVRLLLAAVALAFGGLAAGAVVAHPVAIYGAAFLAGLGTVTWRVTTGPVLMDVADGPWRSRAFSWNVGLLVGSGAAWMALAGTVSTRLLGGGLSPAAAHRAALLVGAVGTALAGLLFARIGHAAARPAHPRSEAAVRPAPSGSARADTGFAARALPPVLVWMLGPALVAPFFNIYFHRVHALTVGQVGLAFALAHAGTAAVLFLNGEIAARRSPRVALALWSLAFAPALWMLGGVGVVEWALLLYFVQGIASPAANPLIDQLLLSSTPASRRGMVSSWRNATTEVAGIAGAAGGGLVLRTTSFGPLFGCAAIVGLVGAVSLLLVLRPERPRPAAGTLPADDLLPRSSPGAG